MTAPGRRLRNLSSNAEAILEGPAPKRNRRSTPGADKRSAMTEDESKNLNIKFWKTGVASAMSADYAAAHRRRTARAASAASEIEFL